MPICPALRGITLILTRLDEKDSLSPFINHEASDIISTTDDSHITPNIMIGGIFHGQEGSL